MITVPLITTRRCILRPLADIDLQRIWDAARTTDLHDSSDWQAPETKEELARLPAHERTLAADGLRLPFTLVSRRGIFLGRILLQKNDGEWHLGHWLLPSARGKGYLTEAATSVLRFAFEVLGAPRVIGSCAKDNTKSVAVFERLGMHPTGMVRSVQRKDGSLRELSVFVLEQEAWERAHAASLASH